MKHIELLHLCNIINLDIFDKHVNLNISNTPLDKFLYSNNDLQLKDDSDRNCFDKYYYSKTGSILSSRFEIHSIWNYNKLYHINPELETSGFFCVVFKKIDTNDLVVVFRSTDAELDDVMTDLDIGLWNNISLQQICAYRLINNRLDIYKSKNTKKVYLLGHSLGGALAQFAYLTYSNDIKDVECITFNNLGVGYSYIKNNLNKFMSKVPSTLIDPYIHRKLPDYESNKNPTPLHYIIKNDLIKLTNQDNPLGTIFDKDVGSFRLKFGICGEVRSNTHPVRPIDLSLPIDAYSRLYEDFIYIKRKLTEIQINDNVNLTKSRSYILSQDWVPCINEQLGYTIILDQNPSIGYLNYKYKDSYKGLKKIGFKYHGLHLFKPFLSDDDNFIK